ncbi:MAG: hypothetical protein E5V63_24235 [Mesorhizobium sp.]|nr:MAG: hypothetical protein E5V63_24235 [Mesorhizobium sp.]
MRILVAIVAALILLCLGMIVHLDKADAQTATPCVPLQPLLDRLVKAFHEFIVLTGKAAGDHQMIVTMSDAGTFSVLLTDGKQACIVIAGEKAVLDNGI